MRALPLCLLVALLALVSLVSVDARNSYLRAHWSVGAAAAPETLHRVRLALKQRNVADLEAFVERVSDPHHEMYGQYLSLEEVADLVAPSQAEVDSLTSALLAAGAAEVSVTKSRDHVSVVLPVKSIQRLFRSAGGEMLHLFHHTHRHSGRSVLRTRHGAEWRMIPELEQYVDIVTGLSDFFDYPTERRAAKNHAAKRAHERALDTKANEPYRMTERQESCTNSAPDFGRVSSSHEDVVVPIVIYCLNGEAATDVSNPCGDFPPAATSVTLTLSPRAHDQQIVTVDIVNLSCSLNANSQVVCLFPRQNFPAWARMTIEASVTYEDGSFSAVGSYGQGLAPSPYVTPNTIFERYSVPIGTRGIASGNSQSVVAFEDQFIDVDGDFRNFARDLGLKFEAPTMYGLNDPTQPGGESTLDIQYITGVAQGVPTTFMSLSNDGPAGSGGPAKPPGDGAYILEWSYHISDVTSPPLVTSISYGDTEQGYFDKFGNYSYITRMEVELAKMAARGLTVLAGSGDAGASNVGEQGNDISDTDPTCAPFRAFYPSSSQYVTSVSSTFLSTNYLPVCQSNLLPSLPIVCQQVGEIAVGVSQGIFWSTGGGFANMSTNTRASWQATVVEEYLATADLPPSALFNSNGRGYPDVATIGHNLLMHFNGNITTVDGTSASGPVMAGLVSLLNDYRLRANQSPLGLLNPFLYQTAAEQSGAFMDVTVGSNNDGDIQPKCSAYPETCPDGFSAGPGWNPVTGLGSPNWAVLKEAALAVGSKDHKRTKFD